MICAQQLYDGLYEQACPDRVILDDRTHLSMGARLRESYQLGYPCTVIISQKVSLTLVYNHGWCLHLEVKHNFCNHKHMGLVPNWILILWSGFVEHIPVFLFTVNMYRHLMICMR